MNHKPMLAVDCGDINKLAFPLYASPKLDGVRALTSPDGMLSRSLKLIPNRRVQTLFEGLPDGLDGELLAGSPTAPDVYRKTVSMVMSDDAPIDGLVYHLFDIVADETFTERHAQLCKRYLRWANTATITRVPQYCLADLAQLERLERSWVDAGYEGVILRKPDSPYKHGRSTRKEGYLLKLKRFVDGEAEVIGFTELMHNGNEATTNALGRTERSHKKAGMIAGGVLGTLIVRDVKTGVEFEIGTGFSAIDRELMWSEHVRLKGRLAKYKHFPSGAKDKPRHPVFLGWRYRRDI